MNYKLYIFPTSQCLKSLKNCGIINHFHQHCYFHSIYEKYYALVESQQPSTINHNLFNLGNDSIFYCGLENVASKKCENEYEKCLNFVKKLYPSNNSFSNVKYVKTKIPADENSQGKRLLSILFTISYEPTTTLLSDKIIHVLIPIDYSDYHNK